MTKESSNTQNNFIPTNYINDSIINKTFNDFSKNKHLTNKLNKCQLKLNSIKSIKDLLINPPNNTFHTFATKILAKVLVKPNKSKELIYNIPTNEFGIVPMHVDTMSDINLVNDIIFAENKTKFGKIGKALAVQTAKGFAELKEYLELNLHRSDKISIPCKFYLCKDIPCNYLIGLPTIHRLGLKLNIQDTIALKNENEFNSRIPKNNLYDITIPPEDNSKTFMNGINIHTYSELTNPQIKDYFYTLTDIPDPKSLQLANHLILQFSDLIPTDDWDVGAVPNYRFPVNLIDNWKHFNVRPHGLSPEHIMNELTNGLMNTQSYMDDILISNGLSDHLNLNSNGNIFKTENSIYNQSTLSEKYIKQLNFKNCKDPIEFHYSLFVLIKVRKYNLKINFKKCKLFQKKLLFIGCQISKDGILPNPEPLSKALNIIKPKTFRQIQQLIGLFNYFQSHIPRFAEVINPIVELLSKTPKTKYNFKKHWLERQDNALLKLKLLLNTAQPLKFPDFNKPFILECDASKVALGAVLCQQQSNGDLGIIACCSKTFGKAQIGMHISDKEVLSCILV